MNYSNIVPYAPAISIMVGSIIGSQATIQNLPRGLLLATSAGFVTASLFTDISSKILSTKQVLHNSLLVGIVVGAIFLVTLQSLDSHSKTHIGKTPQKDREFPLALIGSVCMDFLIDGIIIGQSSNSKVSIGFVLAMTLEGILVASSIINIMKKNRCTSNQIIFASVLMVSASLTGLFIGKKLLTNLSEQTDTVLTGISFVVILWMAMIELLPEARTAYKGNIVLIVWLLTTALGFVIDWNI